MKDEITAIVLTSPIPSHPSTAIIDETIRSVRYHLPESRILIFGDGVRPEEEKRRGDYMSFLGNLSNEMLHVFGDVYLCASFDHVHQIGLMRKYLGFVHTPLLLFMEHDTPLLPEPIDWPGIIDVLNNTDVEYIRFNPETHIPAEHMHLMLDRIDPYGVPLMRTRQFHARPHVATKRFYERLMKQFSPNANCFIEDKAHGICQSGEWHDWPLAIYTPQGNQKRSTHTNGRDGAHKFDELQKF